MAEIEVRICPGCGGRNKPQAEVCEWCARSFAERRRTLRIRWWQLVGAALLAGVLVAVVTLVILNAGRPPPNPFAAGAGRQGGSGPDLSPAPNGQAAVGSPSPEPTRPRPTATRAPTPTSTPTPTPTPEPSSEPEPARYVRVGNTNGLGVNLRREPGPRAATVVAVADNTVLRLLGPEEMVEGRVWQLCEHQARGVEGWVPADFLEETDATPQ